MAKTILVVDDATYMRYMKKKILTGGGYQVVGEASNGMEAVQKYLELRPDLVTMDIVMPFKGGIEATREILSIDPDAKIIMISALGKNRLIKDALQAGAKDYILKPFDQQKLLKVVELVFKEEVKENE